MLLASCSAEDQVSNANSGSATENKILLNTSINNGNSTRIGETASATKGLVTSWSAGDSIDVLVNKNTKVSLARLSDNSFTTTTSDPAIASGFNVGSTIYGVNNRNSDKITTALNGSQLQATIDLTGQKGTLDSLSRYDLMYGKGDPTGTLVFNHKTCVLRFDINSSRLSSDGVTNITDVKMKYVASSGIQLFAQDLVYNFGESCDSTRTDASTLSLLNTNIPVSNGVATIYVTIPQRMALDGTLYIHLKGQIGSAYKQYDLTNPIVLSNINYQMSTVRSRLTTNLTESTTNIGDYLFSDGTWGALENNMGKTPIAIIFSTKTSTTDSLLGWTHGYAMALKNASTSCAWCPNSSSGYLANPTGVTFGGINNGLTDKDGYTHTKAIVDYTTNHGLTLETDFPATYYATTYYNSNVVSAPSNTSGWYMPSAGQFFDFFINLGGMNNYASDAANNNMGYVNYADCMYWSGQDITCANNLNKYLKSLAGGTFDLFTSNDNTNFWSSSESSKYEKYRAQFSAGSNDMYIGAYTDGTLLLQARPVIAF